MHLCPQSALPSGQQNAIARFIAEGARRSPQKPFIESIDQQKAISYAQLHAATNRVAHCLRQWNIRPNERVTILSGNSIEHLLVFVGVMRYGATICTINVETNQQYLLDILRAVGSRVVLVEESLKLERFNDGRSGEWMQLGKWRPRGGTGFFAALADLPETAAVQPVNAPRDDAIIVYTSGTTSRPKGVIVGYADLVANVEALAEALSLTADDRILEFRSFNWLSAQELSALAPLAKGATLVLARKFSQSHYFDWARTYGVTIGVCNPTGIAMLINRPVPVSVADLPALRFITSSSAPLSVEHWTTFEEMYRIPVAQGYGSSEAMWIACSNEKTRRIGSVGLPLATQRLTIVNQDGKALPAGESGEVEVGADPKTTYRYLGYDGLVQTSSVGRLRVGDLGFLDSDGYLHLTGRTTDLIIRGGVNIAPVEIDGILLQIPGVAEAAAVGVPDQIYGEEVIAYVSPNPGETISEDAVLEHCRRKLPAFKVPKEILFKESMPKNDRGKLDRKALVDSWLRTRNVVR
jgi:long-chain acyl-CoA synthetase